MKGFNGFAEVKNAQIKISRFACQALQRLLFFAI
jgi:hypothetical protein